MNFDSFELIMKVITPAWAKIAWTKDKPKQKSPSYKDEDCIIYLKLIKEFSLPACSLTLPE